MIAVREKAKRFAARLVPKRKVVVVAGIRLFLAGACWALSAVLPAGPAAASGFLAKVGLIMAAMALIGHGETVVNQYVNRALVLLSSHQQELASNATR